MIVSDRVGKIKIIRMVNGPNAIDIPFLKNLKYQLTAQRNVDGMLLTGDGKFFSVGLNLFHFHHASHREVKDFIELFNSVLTDFMASPIPTLALVNGYAIGGGCLLALACDYRIGTIGGYQIGINESKLGLTLPPAGKIAIQKSIRSENHRKIFPQGKLLSPNDALKMGVLNELVQEESLSSTGVKKCLTLTQSPEEIKSLRNGLNPELLNDLITHSNGTEEFAAQWFLPETQHKIKSVIRSLERKKSNITERRGTQ